MGKKDIGQKLKNLRAKQSYSVDEVLVELLQKYSIEIRPNTLYGYENGRTSPDVDVFLALCSIYKCQDILIEFGYSSSGENNTIQSYDEQEVLESYRTLPLDGQNMIRGALGLKKNASPKSTNIQTDTENIKDA